LFIGVGAIFFVLPEYFRNVVLQVVFQHTKDMSRRMQRTRCCRYIFLSISFLVSFLVVYSITPCYAKGKKQCGKNVTKKQTINGHSEKKNAVKSLTSPKSKTKKSSSKAVAKKKNHTVATQDSYHYSLSLDDIPDEYEEVIHEYLGTPYRSGGTGTNGIDCSGLSRKFYMELFGVDIPHNSSEQCRLNIFEKVPLNPDGFESSDLLFFKNSKRPINHVGIYLTDHKFLHATPKGGVMISSLDEAYWRENLVASRRIKDTIVARTNGAAVPSVPDSPNEFSASEISLAYAASLGKIARLNLETFYASQYQAQPTKQFEPTNFNFGNFTNPPHRYAASPESWQGVRASADFSPTNWLHITPSLGMLGGPVLPNNINNNWQVYGLDAAVSPTSSRWSLGLSYRSLLNDEFFTAYQDVPNSDIGVNINYRISDVMHFSVLGNMEGYGPRRDSQMDAQPWNVRTVSFNLNLAF
jgi:cell wall-associated NlpC family hydrolase